MELPQPVLEILQQTNSILFWLALGGLMVDGYFVLFHRGIPNIRTAPAIRRAIIERLRQDFSRRSASLGRPYTIVDLGSGNGLFTREIAAALPQARVIGVEIARQSVAWANWMKTRAGLANLEYRTQDFLKFDFDEADAVVMFLLPAVLTDLGQRLRVQTRPGTLITSNKFPLGAGWTPQERTRVRTLYLHQGNLFVYRKEDNAPAPPA